MKASRTAMIPSAVSIRRNVERMSERSETLGRSSSAIAPRIAQQAQKRTSPVGRVLDERTT